MSDKSRIGWTDATWNPLAGCTHVSAGCDNCYAAREASGRLRHLPLYAGLAEDGKFTGEVRLAPERLDQPLRWRRPRMVFVNSMADLFHGAVPEVYIARVFAVMALAQRHTFQVLTKRHGRMQSLLSSPAFWHLVAEQGREHHAGDQAAWLRVGAMLGGQPLPNVWLGVSTEDRRWADVRIPALLETPAAVRWISAEPLLGPIDLNRLGPSRLVSALYPSYDQDGGPARPGLDWVVVGGESGLASRPMNPAWVRSLRDQCVEAGVAFFFKQWGGRTPAANGRELDGRTWDEYPERLSDAAGN